MQSNTFHGSREAKSLPNGLQSQYRINLTLAVTDGRALWTAAAARLLGAVGTTLDDVVEVIGASEDPSISECIATLAKPDGVPGCLLDDFWIDGLARTPPRLETAAARSDGLSEGVERPGRRRSARRPVVPVVPVLHLLAGGATNQNQLD